ncbi:uncharacterized protein IL334_003663 [Kwoniella shivajii]|uniref:Uncharacterized protein n=1 Tax=Kwoniella shivajii TaxID=564305 RepID=A0ABZ1D291_9TREE|nr:hypothetical protein IL334_003663 [Kwoniella shivajii]
MSEAIASSSNIPVTPTYPHGWREIVNGSVEENFVSIALGTLNELIRPDFIPSIEHIQLLLYLTLNPKSHSIKSDLPLNILSRILSLHRPSTFSQAIPFHPSCSKKREEDPVWLQWDYKRSDLHKKVWRCMRLCLDDGIWALLWEKKVEPQTHNQGKRERGIDEDDEEQRDNRRISEEGWKLLEWLIDFWEKDKLDRDVGSAEYSSLFLKQLPRPFDRTGQLPRNDASFPLSILKAAYTNTVKGEEGGRRKSSAVRLLSLVIDTTSGSKPPFHPASLTSSIIHLFRSLRTRDIQDITMRSKRATYWKAATHVLTLLIEDLGGIRNKKVEQRRQKGRSGINSTEQGDFENDIGLDRPTYKYLFDEILLLPLSERAQDIEMIKRMVLLKLELLSIIKQYPYEKGIYEDTKRRLRDDQEWCQRLAKSLDWKSKGNDDEVEDIRLLQDTLKVCVQSILL